MDLLEGGRGALSSAAAWEKKGKQGLVFEFGGGEVGLLGRHGNSPLGCWSFLALTPRPRYS